MPRQPPRQTGPNPLPHRDFRDGTNPNLSSAGYSAEIFLDANGSPGVAVSAVPLPPALGLFAAGLALLVARVRRR